MTVLQHARRVPLVNGEARMERHTIYCSACDREVAVVICSPHDANTSDNTLMNVYCSEIGVRCTGTLCPVCAKSTDLMREELAMSRGT